MKKQLNRMFSVIVAFVLLFVAIPFDNAHASATEFATVGAWLDSLTEGEHAFVSGQKNTSNAVEKYLFIPKNDKYTRDMGYGMSGAKVVVDSTGKKNLVISFDSAKNYTEIHAESAEVSLASEGSYEKTTSKGTSTYYKFTLTIKDISASTFKKVSDVVYDTTEKNLNVTPTHCVKLTNIGVSGVDTNLESAVVLFNLPINESAGGNTGDSGNGGNAEDTNTQTSSAVKVKVMRTGNFSDDRLNTEYNRGYYVSDYKVENGKKNVKVTMTGDFLKMYLGTYTDAQSATGSAVKSLTPNDGKTVVAIDDITLGKTITVSLYQSSMGGQWRQYSFTFESAACDHTYSNGICSKCGAVDFSASSDNVVVTDTKVEVKATTRNDVVITNSSFSSITGKELGLSTKVGTVVFDSNAVAGLIGATTDVTFSMEDLKDTPLYRRAKYDMVLDLNLKDALGNNLFPEGSNGKATITVPYEKEVPAGKTVYVYYIAENGREAVDATYDAETKTVTFVANHFSTYALTQDAVPATNDTLMPTVIVCMILMAAAVIVIASKRKRI